MITLLTFHHHRMIQMVSLDWHLICMHSVDLMERSSIQGTVITTQAAACIIITIINTIIIMAAVIIITTHHPLHPHKWIPNHIITSSIDQSPVRLICPLFFCCCCWICSVCCMTSATFPLHSHTQDTHFSACFPFFSPDRLSSSYPHLLSNVYSCPLLTSFSAAASALSCKRRLFIKCPSPASSSSFFFILTIERERRKQNNTITH